MEQEYHDFSEIFEEIELKPAMKLSRVGKLKERTTWPVNLLTSNNSVSLVANMNTNHMSVAFTRVYFFNTCLIAIILVTIIFVRGWGLASL